MTDTTDLPASADNGNGNAASWLEALPEPERAYVQNKGWDTPDKLLTSYKNLEKVFGADKAGRALLLPGENATPEEKAAFYSKLGRPESPEGYGLKAPEKFGDPELLEGFTKTAHEIGLSKTQAEALLKFQVGHFEQMQAKADAEVNQLKAEWGDKADTYLAAAKKAGAEFGLSDDEITGIELVIGPKRTLEFLRDVGAKLGEARMVDGDQRGGFTESLESLYQQQASLAKDKAWAARYHANDPTARDQWAELQRKIEARIAKEG